MRNVGNQVHAWVQGTGRWNEEQARNVSAALYRAQASDPLVQRVDHVIGSRGRDGAENVFAVYAPYGDREPTFHVRVDGRIASQEPAAV
ncbi:XVIPCD domain-containing protein, partial [Sphingobacterium siyangense]|uniref:XVIPCD domain-containing protein n=1 Tax=Sphingobacterium siyangense TaxID=459529 RepID=UPI0030184F1E